MKNTLLFLAFCVVIFSSCNNQSKDIEDLNYNHSFEEKYQRLKLLEDSIVQLSFCDITLGQPLEKTILNAKKNGKINNINFSNEDFHKVVTCSASIPIPQKGIEEIVNLKIVAFNDTIQKIIVSSENFNTYKDIVELYQNKYNIDYCETDEYLSNYKRYYEKDVDYSYNWTFKNQTLVVSIQSILKEVSFLRNPSEYSIYEDHKDKTLNIFKSINIVYLDHREIKKEELFKEKIKEEENQLKIKEDSIKKSNILKRKNELEKKVQNDI